MTATVAVPVGVGAIFCHVQLSGHLLAALVAYLIVGVTCFCALALALSTGCATADSASAIGPLAATIPAFLSGVHSRGDHADMNARPRQGLSPGTLRQGTADVLPASQLNRDHGGQSRGADRVGSRRAAHRHQDLSMGAKGLGRELTSVPLR